VCSLEDLPEGLQEAIDYERGEDKSKEDNLDFVSVIIRISS